MNPRMQFVGVVAALLLGGCASTQIGQLSLVSSKPVSIVGKKAKPLLQGVEGKHIESIIVFFPTGTPLIDRAVDDALKVAGGGDYMVNARVEHTYWYIPYIFGRTGYKVTGDVYKFEDESLGKK